jgi:hypothetical protein
MMVIAKRRSFGLGRIQIGQQNATNELSAKTVILLLSLSIQFSNRGNLPVHKPMSPRPWLRRALHDKCPLKV